MTFWTIVLAVIVAWTCIVAVCLIIFIALTGTFYRRTKPQATRRPDLDLDLNNPKPLKPDTFLCYQCEKEVAYLFADSRCKDCTQLTREEIEGAAQC